MADQTAKRPNRFTQEEIDRLIAIGDKWDQSKGGLVSWFAKHVDQFPGRRPEALANKYKSLTAQRRLTPAQRLDQALAEYHALEAQIAELVKRRDEKKRVIEQCLKEVQSLLNQLTEAETAVTREELPAK